MFTLPIKKEGSEAEIVVHFPNEAYGDERLFIGPPSSHIKFKDGSLLRYVTYAVQSTDLTQLLLMFAKTIAQIKEQYIYIRSGPTITITTNIITTHAKQPPTLVYNYLLKVRMVSSNNGPDSMEEFV